MAKIFKISAITFLLLIVAGYTLGVESLAPFGWGLSLFIPATIFLSCKNEGVLTSLIGVITGVTAVSLISGIENGISISEMIIPGYAVFYLSEKNIRDGRLALLLTLYFYLVSIGEDFYFGPPKDLSSLQMILPFRWGIYFFSSAFFAVIVIGSITVIGKEKFIFRKINFGVIPVAVFILGGALSILKWFPQLQIIGANVTIAAAGFFLIQGFAIAVSIIDKLSPILRLITFFVAVIFPILGLLIITLLGLFDFWFDFRKLKKEVEK